MAWYALVGMFVGFAGIAGLIWTAILSNKATNAATTATEAAIRSADAAEKAYLAENRPWMDVSIFNIGDISLLDGRVRLNFSVRARNISNAPAAASIFAQGIKSGPFLTAGGGSIDRLLASNHPFFLLSEAIVLPKKSTEMNFQIEAEEDPVLVEQVERMRELNAGKPWPDDINLSIIFGVRYHAVGAAHRYHHANLATLAKADVGSFKMDETVLAKDVRASVLSIGAKLT